MKYSGYTMQERNFVALMRLLTLVFAGIAVLFTFAPDYLPNYIAGIGRTFFNWPSPANPPVDNFYWVIFTIVQFVTLVYLCALVQIKPVENMGYARPIILVMFASSIGFLSCFFLYEKPFLYLVVAVATALIAIVTLWMYLKAYESRT